MMTEPNIFTVGGTVQANAYGIYIDRPADAELLKLCRSAEFTYVLTPRQMGKSSLMIRTAEQLIEDGIFPVIVDLQKIGTEVTAEAWYKGVLTEISDQLGLNTSVEPWWQKYSYLSVTQRLTHFFEKVIQTQIQQQIVVFVDEIDTTISLDFTDDFYAAIRSLYLARSTQTGLRRLSFVLIGVANPNDLVKNKNRTQFNIGKSIELDGFTLSEALPLAEGLVNLGNSYALLKVILYWTKGQPFLTQKICKILQNEKKKIQSGDEVSGIKKLIKDRVIDNWISKDNPVHLMTIEDRICSEGKKKYDLLRLYEEILKSSEGKPNKDSDIEKVLKLSGLVSIQKGKLRVSNPIYESIFDRNWILEKRDNPFLKEITEWLSSNQDDDFLLSGEKLKQYDDWAEGKNLSEKDKNYLNKSKELEKINAQEKLKNTKSKTIKFEVIGSIAMVVTFISATIFAYYAKTLFDQTKALLTQTNELALVNERVCYSFFDKSIGYITAQNFIKDGRYLVAGDDSGSLKSIDLESECNSKAAFLRIHKKVISVKSNPKKDQIASAGLDGKVILSKNDNGADNNRSLLGNNTNPVTAIDFSPDGQYLAIVTIPIFMQAVPTKTKETEVTKVSIWNTNTREKVYENKNKINNILTSITFSQDGQYLAANNVTTNESMIWKWDRQNRRLKDIKDNDMKKNMLGKKDKAKVITFSPRDNHLAIGYSSGLIRILNLNSQSEKAKSIKIDEEISKIAFSPDGKTLAIIGLNSTQGAQLWKWNSPGNQADVSKTNRSGSDSSLVKNLAFSHDNKLALVLEREVQLWSNNNNNKSDNDYEFIMRQNISQELIAIEFYSKKENNTKVSIIVGVDSYGQVFTIDLP